MGEIKNRALTTLQQLCTAEPFFFYTKRKAEAIAELRCGLADMLKERQRDSWFSAMLQVELDYLYCHLKSKICVPTKSPGWAESGVLAYTVSLFTLTFDHQWREHWIRRARYPKCKVFWTLQTVFSLCFESCSRQVRMLCFMYLETLHMKKGKKWSVFLWALCSCECCKEQCLIVLVLRPHTESYFTLSKTVFQAVTRWTFLGRPKEKTEKTEAIWRLPTEARTAVSLIASTSPTFSSPKNQTQILQTHITCNWGAKWLKKGGIAFISLFARLAKPFMQKELLPSFPVQREICIYPGRLFLQRCYCPCSCRPGPQSTTELGRWPAWKNGLMWCNESASSWFRNLKSICIFLLFCSVNWMLFITFEQWLTRRSPQ